MAFAPLDAWARLLFSPTADLPFLYWPRLAFSLFTSFFATILTLPERLLLTPLLRRRSTLRTPPVIILGYFRSGTTHLHYLLSCDPRFRTPTWCETLAPQGFAISWAFLRLFMIPFVSAKRPQDDVAIGPSWPAEDDFAVNNWALASSLPGRFVLPRLHAHYDRFHSLASLTPRELNRWQQTQLAFCRKLGWLSPRRTILLKSPSHTGRIRELLALFGDSVRFVHISRDPTAVIRSNVAMASRLSIYHLQPPSPGEDDLAARITAEYLDTERRYLDQSAAVPPDRLVELRYEDLIADPLAELRRIYETLRIPWTAEFEQRALAYLTTVRDYKPAAGPAPRDAAPPSPLSDDLAALASRFGHTHPPRPKAEVPPTPLARSRPVRGSLYALIAAVACAVLWMDQAWILRDRHDWLAWPVGVAIGWAAIRAGRAGSVGLGLLCAALTLVVILTTALPSTFLADYAWRRESFPFNYRDLPMDRWEWFHIKKATRHGLLTWSNIFWAFMGAVTAYRFASRPHVNPPGTG
jgi:hypothetical protein